MTAGQGGTAQKNPSFTCTKCGMHFPLHGPRWRCECGGLLDIVQSSMFDPAQIDAELPGIARYSRFIPLPDPHPPKGLSAAAHPLLSLGEGRSAFLPYTACRLPPSVNLLVLHDHLNPSGSFKDRGAAVLLSAVARYGLETVVEDSSGNAGAAIAAYAAAAGIGARVFAPEGTSRSKISQIEAYGAEVVTVPGSREHTAETALKAAENSYYASHSWNPFFFHGIKTIAYEVSEGLGWKSPDAMVLPCGNGTLILGVYIGFRELLEAGIVSRTPRLIAVQAAGCAPVYAEWAGRDGMHGGAAGGGRTAVCPAPHKPAAEGIQVAAPVRLGQIIEAITETKGAVYTLTDEEIWTSCRDAWQKGIYIEPTAAVSIAGCKKYLDISGNNNEIIATVFTGHGLKMKTAVGKYEPEK